MYVTHKGMAEEWLHDYLYTQHPQLIPRWVLMNDAQLEGLSVASVQRAMTALRKQGVTMIVRTGTWQSETGWGMRTDYYESLATNEQ